jgi:hypothetical protein
MPPARLCAAAGAAVLAVGVMLLFFVLEVRSQRQGLSAIRGRLRIADTA